MSRDALAQSSRPESGDAWVVPHLVHRGLLDERKGVDVTRLSGGVSGDVFSVSAPGRRLVVKRALAQLRVAEVWHADPGRVEREADALRVVGEIDADVVPEVVDFDPDAGILVMAHAPSSWHEWRSDLFDGRADQRVAGRLAAALAAVHRETMDVDRLRDRFGDKTAFVQLRLDPFHRRIAEAHPAHRETIMALADELAAAETCLVHGDCSPKNVLVGPDRGWLIDWEVAHLGDPTFDLAFLLTHLVLKSVYLPRLASSYQQLASEFLAEYAARSGPADVEGPSLTVNTACLLLARVDGKSPATYLDARQQVATRELALRLLDGPPINVLNVWSLMS